MSTQKDKNPSKNRDNVRSMIIEIIMKKVLVGIVIGFTVAVLTALFSNTTHWTWIFDYIIIGLIILAATISSLIESKNLWRWIHHFSAGFFTISVFWIYMTNYHSWNEHNLVMIVFILLLLTIIWLISFPKFHFKLNVKSSIKTLSIIFLLLLTFSSIIIWDYQNPEKLVDKKFPYYNAAEKIIVEVPEQNNFSDETYISGFLDRSNGIQIAVKYNGTDLGDFIREKDQDRNKYAWDLTGRDLPVGTLGWKTTTGWYHILIINPKLNNNSSHKGVVAVFIGSRNEEKTIEMVENMVFINKTDKWDIFGNPNNT